MLFVDACENMLPVNDGGVNILPLICGTEPDVNIKLCEPPRCLINPAVAAAGDWNIFELPLTTVAVVNALFLNIKFELLAVADDVIYAKDDVNPSATIHTALP